MKSPSPSIAAFSWRNAPSGFSLVEVTLAIGIISFSLLTVLGLMPVGLTTLRQATEQTIESQIVQKIGSEVQLTSYSKLAANFSGKTFYYSDQGDYLGSSPASVPADTRYRAVATLSNSVFPGSTNAPSALSDSLVTMRIDIVRVSGGAAAKNTNSYSLQIPNSGS